MKGAAVSPSFRTVYRPGVVWIAAPIVIALAMGCEPEESSTAQTTSAPPEVYIAEPDIDADNLLSIARGATVISRSAEMHLEHSALHAIDGLPWTMWAAPPGGPNQTLVYSLAARTSIEKLGVTVLKDASTSADGIRISTSLDGTTWMPAVTIEPKPSETPQIFATTPVDAQFIRVETLEKSDYLTQIRSIHVLGKESTTPASSTAAGCWVINGERTTIVRQGGRVTGTIAGPKTTYLEGGAEGPVLRLMWFRPPMWGYAIASSSPDGRHFSALTFHEEPFTENAGSAWFGQRCDSSEAASPADPRKLLQRTGRWSLFGLSFDGNDRLVENASAFTLDTVAAILKEDPRRHRLVAREFRAGAPELNRTTSAARLEAVKTALRKRGVDIDRVATVAAGSDWKGRPISVTTQYVLMSRIDLETK